MLLDTNPAIPRSLDDLLGPGLAARLDRLDVASRKVFAGKLPGERRSKRRGQSVEFDDYRAYIPGDDLRHLDWNILARLDRYVIKLFREEEDLELRLLIDVSPSMLGADPPQRGGRGGGDDAPPRPPTKLTHALRLAAALAYVGLVNNNRLSIRAFGLPGADAEVGGLRGRRRLERAVSFLLDVAERGLSARPADAAASDSGAAPIARGFRDQMRAAAQPGGRGVLVLVSDMLHRGDIGAGLKVLRAGAGSGSLDASVVQVLTERELDPTIDAASGFAGDLRLTDAESAAAAAEVSLSKQLLDAYRRRLDAHLSHVRAACARYGVRHVLTTTARPVDDLVTGELRRGGIVG